ncbi:hypothetical protein TEA_028600 [Camellia sinensis var. sinensis]|uniref:Aminotransferase class I/classII large domain-containing protein n=1 Tax=Camellia sinensis var. sinensis TaxID=542762 RepID=A0A4V6RYP7_CAMSN|nr:hypothetical protein TEA_028600 [Camellia sinensis var. sinensis]
MIIDKTHEAVPGKPIATSSSPRASTAISPSSDPRKQSPPADLYVNDSLHQIRVCSPNLMNFVYVLLSQIVNRIKACLNVTSGPATSIQGAIPHFLANTTEDFFLKTLNVLREAADFCYDKHEEIPCITCPHKAEGSMFVMVKLNLSLLEGINDDMEFCGKLAKEESVIVLPGVALGLKNWLRITFATEPSSLEDGLGRINAFCLRHAKKD